MRERMKQIWRRKVFVILCTAILLAACLAGCGNIMTESVPVSGEQSGASTSVQGGKDSDTENANSASGAQSVDVGQLLQGDGDDDIEAIWAGTQFYNGEELVLYRKMNGSEEMKKGQDIYLKNSQGSVQKIISGVSNEYTGTWFYTHQGYCLTILENSLVRFEADGTEKFNLIVEGGVSSIVQLDDGTIVLLIRDSENVFRLAVLNPEDGTYEKVQGLDLGKDKRLYISAAPEGVVVLNREGFWNVNLETGELTERIPLTEYDYTVPYNIKAFRMIGGGGVRLLFQNSNDVLFPINIEKYKTIVEVLGPDNQWLKEWLVCFNKHSEAYYAVLVPFEDEDTPEKTAKKLHNTLEFGVGADVVYGECFESTTAAMASGYLENLSPYMERSGVDQEDYFPGTFDDFKKEGQIYGTYIFSGTRGWSVSEELLEGRIVPDMEGLVNALLSYTEPAFLYYNAENNLKYFLAASESLAGAVDWENLTCNFHTNLFASVLEVSKLYARDYQTKDVPILNDVQLTSNFYSFENEEQLRMAKQVYIGYLFDDGAHPAAANFSPFYINNRSINKDGAWALIEFLLSETFQVQNDIYMDEEVWYGTERILNVYRHCPVNVYVFDEIVRMEQEESAIVEFVRPDWTVKIYKASMAKQYMDLGDEGYRGLHNLKDADAEEMLERLYLARPLPTKTLELQEIIYEEAASYFNGERSLGDTCEAIQQRAQAYLDSYEE